MNLIDDGIHAHVGTVPSEQHSVPTYLEYIGFAVILRKSDTVFAVTDPVRVWILWMERI